METKENEFAKSFEKVKCVDRNCNNMADIFVVVRMRNPDGSLKIIKTALCANHVLSFIQNWIPSIENKHKEFNIVNLPLSPSLGLSSKTNNKR